MICSIVNVSCASGSEFVSMCEYYACVPHLTGAVVAAAITITAIVMIIRHVAPEAFQ